ncbi:uncharacterized protein LOC119321327 [Triticum dicoccoides]|uniref:uncharacterized protein LOC119321327 n=1 Tax=Triticum dicoccoides TaxID=85692 RepID=UPI001891198A|nr:uncharacterized protein LOC119321327 [Triticum dicoccoides]
MPVLSSRERVEMVTMLEELIEKLWWEQQEALALSPHHFASPETDWATTTINLSLICPALTKLVARTTSTFSSRTTSSSSRAVRLPQPRAEPREAAPLTAASRRRSHGKPRRSPGARPRRAVRRLPSRGSPPPPRVAASPATGARPRRGSCPAAGRHLPSHRSRPAAPVELQYFFPVFHLGSNYGLRFVHSDAIAAPPLLASPPTRSIKESILRWLMLNAAEDYSVIPRRHSQQAPGHGFVSAKGCQQSIQKEERAAAREEKLRTRHMLQINSYF